MAQTFIELIDRTDLAEWANADNLPLGTIPLEYGSVMDTDFGNHSEAEGRRIAYVESSYLQVGSFFHADQGLSAVLASLADCLANQEDGDTSEFVIPLSEDNSLFVHIILAPDDATRT